MPDATNKGMLKQRPKEWLPEREDPGENEPEYCSPGSIEQGLDMCETGTLRGDEILHHHGILQTNMEPDQDPVELDTLLEENYRVDLAEEDREGADMSGDEHSSGLQGGESELAGQLHIDTGIPGNLNPKQEVIER